MGQKLSVILDKHCARGIAEARQTATIEPPSISFQGITSKALTELLTFNELCEAKLKTRRLRRDVKRYLELSHQQQRNFLMSSNVYLHEATSDFEEGDENDSYEIAQGIAEEEDVDWGSDPDDDDAALPPARNVKQRRDPAETTHHMSPGFQAVLVEKLKSCRLVRE